MQRTAINNAWDFTFGEPSSLMGIPQESKIVNLPHDFMIGRNVAPDSAGGAEAGFYTGATGAYTKRIAFSAEELSKRNVLCIDGCAGNTKVIVNGHLAARHHYAYTAFDVDLGPYLVEGDNRITIVASNTDQPNGRWYTGAGLYRGVELLSAPSIHISNNGIFAYTKSISESGAIIGIDVSLENHTSRAQTVDVSIELHDRVNPFFPSEALNTSGPVGEAKAIAWVEAESSAVVHTQIYVPNARLWDLDSPSLYETRVRTVAVGGLHPSLQDQESSEQTVDDSRDEATAVFGIRTITVDATNGLRLNGKTIKLKGGCIHHDNGIIGAAANHDSEYRKVLLHKHNGFMALRMAHNPPSTELLNACDEIGLLVFNEAFDVWNMEKNTYDFAQYFASEWEKELTSFVLRDRNHPCVFAWSVGNEIPEQGGLSDGYTTSAKLTEKVRQLDPTRPVGGALCSFFRGLDDADNARYWQDIFMHRDELMNNGSINLDCPFGKSIWPCYTAPFAASWDIVGYNYLNYQYEASHELFPNRVICCTESKPGELAKYWEDAMRLPYVIGDFEWTSMDYIGEAGIGNTQYVDEDAVEQAMMSMHFAAYPLRLAGAGDFDICGFEKPQLAYRRVVWGSQETYITSHNPANYRKVEILGRYGWADCGHTWSWPAEVGTPIKLEVYSSAPYVELIVNGENVGTATAGKENDFRAIFHTRYMPGKVVAISRSEDGKEISRDMVVSAGRPAEIQITEDKIVSELHQAEGKRGRGDAGLYYAVIEITDEDGALISYAEDTISVAVEGAGSLLGLGTGRISTEENYTSGTIKMYRGKALAVIAGAEKGKTTIKVVSDNISQSIKEL